MYEESQRQLHITIDQYGVAQRRLQALSAELEDLRGNLEAVSSFVFIFINRQMIRPI